VKLFLISAAGAAIARAPLLAQNRRAFGPEFSRQLGHQVVAISSSPATCSELCDRAGKPSWTAHRRAVPWLKSRSAHLLPRPEGEVGCRSIRGGEIGDMRNASMWVISRVIRNCTASSFRPLAPLNRVRCRFVTTDVCRRADGSYRSGRDRRQYPSRPRSVTPISGWRSSGHGLRNAGVT